MAGQEVAQRDPVSLVVSQVRSDQFLEQVRLALPSNMRPERFVRAVVTAVQQNPEVVVDAPTLFSSAIKCAQDGLIPDGREAAFVIFSGKDGKKVQYLPMIGGYRKIAANHGIVLVADVVHERDTFSWSKMPPRVEHTPLLGDERGEVVCAYAAAFDRDWRFVTAPVVMTVREIEKVRQSSRAKNNGPWVDWWERMAVKTVARRLFHELPLRDLDELEERIVRQADVDADLPDANGTPLTPDEANIAAGLTNAWPPDGDQPDDDAGEIVDETDEAATSGSGPSSEEAKQEATSEQASRLIQVTADLEREFPDRDWQQEAFEYAQAQFETPLPELGERDMEHVLAHLQAQLPKPAKRGAK